MSFASFQWGNYSSDASKSRDDLHLPQDRRKELQKKAPDGRQRLSSTEKEQTVAGSEGLPKEKTASLQYTLDSVSGSATAGDGENMPKFDKLPRSQGALFASVWQVAARHAITVGLTVRRRSQTPSNGVGSALRAFQSPKLVARRRKRHVIREFAKMAFPQSQLRSLQIKRRFTIATEQGNGTEGKSSW